MKKKTLDINGMKRELRKKQDILCGDDNTHIHWLSLALQMVTHGDVVRAKIVPPYREEELQLK